MLFTELGFRAQGLEHRVRSSAGVSGCCRSADLLVKVAVVLSLIVSIVMASIGISMGISIDISIDSLRVCYPSTLGFPALRFLTGLVTIRVAALVCPGHRGRI